MLNLLRLLKLAPLMMPEGDPPAGGGGAPQGGAAPAGGGKPSDPPAGGAPASGGGAAAPAGGGAAPAKDEKSLLREAQEAAEAAKRAGLPAEPLEKRIAEKYRVYEGEGEARKFNLEKTLEKVNEAHGSLEKRLGDVGAPPEKPEGYEVKLPDDIKVEKALLDGPLLETFRKDAHTLGLSQKQFDGALAAHLRSLDQFFSALGDHSAKMAREELGKDPAWAGPEFDKNLGLAYKFFGAFATQDELAEIDRIGSNPIFLKVMARAGAHVGEANLRLGPGAGASLLQDTTLAEYMKPGSPYFDKAHPDHAKAVEIVNRHYEAKYGTRPAMVGVINQPAPAQAGKQ
jgi:hypothetical protein